MGAYAGCGISYLLVKNYVTYSTTSFAYLLEPQIGFLYFSDDLQDVYWGRLILQEVLQTFVFTLVYLVLKYDAVLSKTDRILKGVCLCFILLACLSMTRSSGGCLNPAIGLAQSTYMLGLLPAGSDVASNAKFMWVYILMPFLGAILAACLYFFHASVED